MTNRVSFALAGAAIALAAAAMADAQTPLFSDDAPIRFTIEAPFADLERAAPRSTDPFPATVTLFDDAGASQAFEIELSPRGLSRRTRGYCDHTPLRLDFDKDELDGTLLEGQNRLKLVRNCQDSERYAQLVAIEYLAYKLYNELTPLSFRVRPAEITYRDPGRRGREETFFGFLIEDDDDLAERNGRIALELASGELDPAGIDPAAAARYALFQYMIGNVDWDMTHGPEADECCHNNTLIALEAAPWTGVTPVPYDFDNSGLVDAPYAVPPEALNLRNVRERAFRGRCIHAAALPAAVLELQAKKDALLAIVDGETRLSESRRRTARAYIEDFFETLDEPRRFERRIVEDCLG